MRFLRQHPETQGQDKWSEEGSDSSARAGAGRHGGVAADGSGAPGVRRQQAAQRVSQEAAEAAQRREAHDALSRPPVWGFIGKNRCLNPSAAHLAHQRAA